MLLLLETVEESGARVKARSWASRADGRCHQDSRLLWEMDQLPESRASQASDWCLRRTGLCSAGVRVLVREAMEGRACP
jgi:hypothetical protein